MTVSDIDPCLFYKINSNELEGIQVAQLHDACGGENKEFESLEADKSKSVKTKPKTNVFPIKFNGLAIDKLIGKKGFVTHQPDYCDTVK